ncbi:hypothetical protein, partial [Crenobacter luteus]|uniref:hypothetical protein n=1 Tax=Crenobacter luteus TaxID=1452487 RepID=UPI001A9CC5AC
HTYRLFDLLKSGLRRVVVSFALQRGGELYPPPSATSTPLARKNAKNYRKPNNSSTSRCF